MFDGRFKNDWTCKKCLQVLVWLHISEILLWVCSFCVYKQRSVFPIYEACASQASEFLNSRALIFFRRGVFQS